MATDVAFGMRPAWQAGEQPIGAAGETAGEVVFVTNRGPIEHRFGLDGAPESQRGAGGVVSGLLCAAEGRRVTWVSLAMTDADRAVARGAHEEDESLAVPGLESIAAKLVDVPPAIFRAHYDGFSNRVLWFLQHGLHDACDCTLEDIWSWWDGGYVPANAAAAASVAREPAVASGRAPVVFHDYHLYLAPALVRRRLPHARLAHFVHIPWPAPDAWARLPEPIVRRIYEGLAANDVIGFQTERDARHFLHGAARYLPGARTTGEPEVLRWQGRDVRVGAYPIAVTPETVQSLARRPDANAAADELLRAAGADRGRKVILRVDRVEPTKNIARGFEAYERLLDEHPELRGRVSFLALLVPSREGLRVYRECAAQVEEVVERINARYGTDDWQPVVAVYGNDHARALACMRACDVLLVNPLADGMNLVAKECAIVNECDGVIVLSREAGAHAQLYSAVLSISPLDVDDTACALHEALTLPEWDRTLLRARAQSIVLGESARSWLEEQLADLGTTATPVATAAVATRPPERHPASLRDALDALDALQRGMTHELDDLDHLPPPRPAPRPTIPLS